MSFGTTFASESVHDTTQPNLTAAAIPPFASLDTQNGTVSGRTAGHTTLAASAGPGTLRPTTHVALRDQPREDPAGRPLEDAPNTTSLALFPFRQLCSSPQVPRAREPFLRAVWESFFHDDTFPQAFYSPPPSVMRAMRFTP